MDEKIKHTEMMSALDNYHGLGLDLYLTPGSTRPYWASRANFTYDEVVATPWDFLEAAGYDSFEDDPDYDNCDELITIEIDWIDPAPHVEF